MELSNCLCRRPFPRVDQMKRDRAPSRRARVCPQFDRPKPFPFGTLSESTSWAWHGLRDPDYDVLILLVKAQRQSSRALDRMRRPEPATA